MTEMLEQIAKNKEMALKRLYGTYKPVNAMVFSRKSGLERRAFFGVLKTKAFTVGGDAYLNHARPHPSRDAGADRGEQGDGARTPPWHILDSIAVSMVHRSQYGT